MSGTLAWGQVLEVNEFNGLFLSCLVLLAPTVAVKIHLNNGVGAEGPFAS